jgi:Flp pilus assembly protein TadG
MWAIIERLSKAKLPGPGVATGARQRGQSMVEFAVITSLLIVPLMVGMVDFGRVFYFDVVVSAAANEAARAASLGLPDADVRLAAQNSAPSWLSSALPDANITITPSQAGRTAGTTQVWTTVTVSYVFTPITPLTQMMVGANHTITRSVSQRMRGPCVTSAGAACT